MVREWRAACAHALHRFWHAAPARGPALRALRAGPFHPPAPTPARPPLHPPRAQADFGLSKHKYNTFCSNVHDLRGTLPYMAPEMIMDHTHVTGAPGLLRLRCAAAVLLLLLVCCCLACRRPAADFALLLPPLHARCLLALGPTRGRALPASPACVPQRRPTCGAWAWCFGRC